MPHARPSIDAESTSHNHRAHPTVAHPILSHPTVRSNAPHARPSTTKPFSPSTAVSPRPRRRQSRLRPPSTPRVATAVIRAHSLPWGRSRTGRRRRTQRALGRRRPVAAADNKEEVAVMAVVARGRGSAGAGVETGVGREGVGSEMGMRLRQAPPPRNGTSSGCPRTIWAGRYLRVSVCLHGFLIPKTLIPHITPHAHLAQTDLLLLQLRPLPPRARVPVLPHAGRVHRQRAVQEGAGSIHRRRRRQRGVRVAAHVRVIMTCVCVRVIMTRTRVCVCV